MSNYNTPNDNMFNILLHLFFSFLMGVTDLLFCLPGLCYYPYIEGLNLFNKINVNDTYLNCTYVNVGFYLLFLISPMPITVSYFMKRCREFYLAFRDSKAKHPYISIPESYEKVQKRSRSYYLLFYGDYEKECKDS